MSQQLMLKKMSWMVYEDLQDLLELTPKRCPFLHKGLECKSRKSDNIWSTKWTMGNTNRALSREHTGHSKHPLPTTQETTLHMNITRWSIPKPCWLYSLQPEMRSSIQSAKIRLGSDCGSDHELLIAKFWLEESREKDWDIPV